MKLLSNTTFLICYAMDERHEQGNVSALANFLFSNRDTSPGLVQVDPCDVIGPHGGIEQVFRMYADIFIEGVRIYNDLGPGRLPPLTDLCPNTIPWISERMQSTLGIRPIFQFLEAGPMPDSLAQYEIKPHSSCLEKNELKDLWLGCKLKFEVAFNGPPTCA